MTIYSVNMIQVERERRQPWHSGEADPDPGRAHVAQVVRRHVEGQVRHLTQHRAWRFTSGSGY